MDQRSKLECFVKATISQDKDAYSVQQLVQEISDCYGTDFTDMIQVLNFNKNTIRSGLEIVAEDMTLRGDKFYHVLVLLSFCIKLDQYCKSTQSHWYTVEMLVQIISDILWKINFVPPSAATFSSIYARYSVKICVIILIFSIIKIFVCQK
jgi:hypothetical protein